MGAKITLSLLLFTTYLVSGGNIVPNSSFECGTGRGWSAWDTAGFNAQLGNDRFITEQWTNQAVFGGHGFLSPTSARMLSRAIWLTNEFGSDKTYCLSWYQKAQNADSLIFGGVVAYSASLFGYIPPQNSNATSAGWTRVSTNLTVSSNNFYYIKFIANPGAFFDGIQLEPGTSPTAYSPASTVEMGVQIDGTYNMFWSGGVAPTCRLMFWNDGTDATVRYEYYVVNSLGSNTTGLVRGTVALSANTNTTLSITLPVTYGHFQVMTRLLDYNDSYDQAPYIYYPFASNSVANVTGWLGGHAEGSLFHAVKEIMSGRSISRTLSPNSRNDRWTTVEPTRDSFIYRPAEITNWGVAGLIGLGCLTPTDGTWPTWATNDNTRTNLDFPGPWWNSTVIGSADGMAVSNYAFTTVWTNRSYITNWEVGPNEPLQTASYGNGSSTNINNITNLPVNLRWPTNYARIASYMIDGITNANSTARIIFIGGSSGGGSWAADAWAELSANRKLWVYGASTHQYLQDNAADPNDLFTPGIKFSFPGSWRDYLPGMPIWNTEIFHSGPFGYAQGLNGMWPENYDPMADLQGYPEADRNERRGRQVYSMSRGLAQALRCVGYGFEKYFHYDNRSSPDNNFVSTQPYASDNLQVDRPEIVALSVAQSLVKRGVGPITNTTSIYLEMYANTNAAGDAVVTAWCEDKTNRIVVLDNAEVAQQDHYGNLVQTNSATLRLTRLPQYFTSGTRTLAQLSNSFRTATVTLIPATNAPNVIIAIAPTGLWSGDTNKVLIHWNGIDETFAQWASNTTTFSTQHATNIVYKWHMDSDAYNTPSQSNHVWVDHLSAGNHTFSVTAINAAGKSSEVTYEFSPEDHPISAVSATGRINVSGRVAISQ